MSVQDAFSQVLDDLNDEVGGLCVEECLAVKELLMTETSLVFAETVDWYDDEVDLQNIFDEFCNRNQLEEDLANNIALAIEKGTALDSYDYGEDEDEGSEDADVIFFNFERLDDNEKAAKVSAFLKKVAHCARDFSDNRPFIKDLRMADRLDPYGTRYVGNVKTFDRKANRYGHRPNGDVIGEGTLLFPIVSNMGHDPDHTWHPLHSTALKHGYRYDHTTPVHDPVNNTVVHHHTWSDAQRHTVAAFAGDTKWTTKTPNAAKPTQSGIGRVSLDKHLSQKAKRYRLPERRELPSLPITEGLLDPTAPMRMHAYTQAMSNFRTYSGGLEASRHEPNPAQELREQLALKDKVKKLFGDTTGPHFKEKY